MVRFAGPAAAKENDRAGDTRALTLLIRTSMTDPFLSQTEVDRNARCQRRRRGLAGGLAPADRERFRREAEATLALSPHALGPGSIYRTLVPVWRKFFHPTRDDRRTGWERGRERNSNNLIEAPGAEDGRAYRNLRIDK